MMTAQNDYLFPMDSNALSVESTALLGLLADIRAAVGDPTGKLMQDELVERCRRMSDVIDAARCIRHWHDREPDGMVVSKSHVFALWQTLNELDKPNDQALAQTERNQTTTP